MRLCVLPLSLGLCLVGAPLAAQRIPVRRPARSAPAKDAPARADTVKPAPSAPEVPKFAYLQGVLRDSVHDEPLTGAVVHVEGTPRVGITDSLGRFLVDSILPGTHRMIVDHALLDTIGISLVTPPMTFVVNEITRVMLAVPSGETLTKLFCTPARLALGPGALVGRVREPDTEEAAEGARVSFVWYDPDFPGMPSNLRVKKPPRVREAIVTAEGTYRLCGLPATFEGKLQVQRKDGGATAEVVVSQTDGVLTLRSMSVAALPRVIATDSAGKVTVQKGTARVSGRVLNANGAPVAGARVGLMGVSAATRTRANGDFVLDSLPSGTQAIIVRQIGFRPTEVPVELSARAPQRVTIKLGIFVPELSPVEVVSVREDGLQQVGYTSRKRSSASGSFMDGDVIEKRDAQVFTDLLRTMPGLRVNNVNGQALVTSSRTASGDGCVTVFVDGSKWQQLEAGDLDSFIRPQEIAAIEVYAGISLPPQFQTPGQTCAAVVVWTKTRVEKRRK